MRRRTCRTCRTSALALSALLALLSFAACAAAGGSPATSDTATSGTPSSVSTKDGHTFLHRSVTLSGGTTIQYAVVLPPGFDPSRTYPILLALPPGGQDLDTVDALVNAYWIRGAARGWIVLSPAAPGGQLYFEGAESLIPDFLDRTAQDYHPEGGTYAIAGISNGGLSAFRIILNTPRRFQALLTLPGYPPADADQQKLPTIAKLPIALYVGAQDDGWRQQVEQTYRDLKALGAPVSLTVVPGKAHILDGAVNPDTLFDFLDASRNAHP
jgi:acetyl esterase/lipase